MAENVIGERSMDAANCYRESSQFTGLCPNPSSPLQGSRDGCPNQAPSKKNT